MLLLVVAVTYLFSLVAVRGATQTSAVVDSSLTPFQRRHPALHQQLVSRRNRRRLSEQQQEDGVQPGFGCETSEDETTIQCKMSFGGGTYEVDETCRSNGPSQDVLSCDVCAENNGVMLEDGSQVTFCYKFTCEITAADVFADGDFSKACTCDEANVNGEAWYVLRVFQNLFTVSSLQLAQWRAPANLLLSCFLDSTFCEFCETKTRTDYADAFENQMQLLTPPLALECPHMDVVSSDCPANAPTEGMSGGAKFGTVLVVFSVVGIAAYCFVARRRKNRNEKEEIEEPSPAYPSDDDFVTSDDDAL